MTQISNEGIELIQTLEGLKLEACLNLFGELAIGYGHTESVAVGDTITQEEAEKTLSSDLAPIEDFINDEVTAELNQNQFDSLVSLVFNIGSPSFLASSLLENINSGASMEAIQASFLELAEGENITALKERRLTEASYYGKPIKPNLGGGAAPMPPFKKKK